MATLRREMDDCTLNDATNEIDLPNWERGRCTVWNARSDARNISHPSARQDYLEKTTPYLGYLANRHVNKCGSLLSIGRHGLFDSTLVELISPRPQDGHGGVRGWQTYVGSILCCESGDGIHLDLPALAAQCKVSLKPWI
eukprot:SAG11_NODE_141_length_14934_cov_4.821503_17_plen_140_part_00